MIVNSQTAGPDRGHAIVASITFLALIKARANAAMKALQMARMLSVLSKLNESQLAQIGILRSDIPDYAAKVMADD